MTTEQFIIVALSSVCSLLLVGLLWMIGTKDVQTKTVVKKEPIVYDIENVRKWMLRVGVSGAFVEDVGSKKADCFVTTMFPNGSALSYCELRR